MEIVSSVQNALRILKGLGPEIDFNRLSFDQRVIEGRTEW
jgi:hypothetical protein